ncbi:MAG TPA: preprotein translocase subunit SecA, partial [Coriobacteriia bacterium]|nr:preprotein translocase subunit SecA [Coriobacteriia bacterium]
RQVESMHFDSRKQVLEYDDVMNRQRSAIYGERNAILDGKDIHNRALDIMQKTVEETISQYCGTVRDDWDIEGLQQWLVELTGIEDFKVETLIGERDDADDVAGALFGYLEKILTEKEQTLGEADLRKLETQVMLRIMDTRWMNHLQEMDYLKAGIGLRAFGQRDPLTEYKNEAHLAFAELRDSMFADYLRTVLRIKIVVQAPEPEQLNTAQYSGPSEDVPSLMAEARSQAAAQRSVTVTTPDGRQMRQGAPVKTATITKDKNDPFADVGRNDPCPCGSGTKYKKCHGANAG